MVTATQTECLCGCGLTFDGSGQRVYFDRTHKENARKRRWREDNPDHLAATRDRKKAGAPLCKCGCGVNTSQQGRDYRVGHRKGHALAIKRQIITTEIERLGGGCGECQTTKRLHWHHNTERLFTETNTDWSKVSIRVIREELTRSLLLCQPCHFKLHCARGDLGTRDDPRESDMPYLDLHLGIEEPVN